MDRNSSEYVLRSSVQGMIDAAVLERTRKLMDYAQKLTDEFDWVGTGSYAAGEVDRIEHQNELDNLVGLRKIGGAE